jgi:hypothetical protein
MEQGFAETTASPFSPFIINRDFLSYENYVDTYHVIRHYLHVVSSISCFLHGNY